MWFDTPFRCLLFLLCLLMMNVNGLDIISQTVVEIQSPAAHGRYQPNSHIPVQISLIFEESQDVWYDEGTGLLTFHPEIDKIKAKPLIINASGSPSYGDVISEWSNHSGGGLSEKNKRYLADRVQDAMDQVRCNLPSSCPGVMDRKICIALDDHAEECMEVQAFTSPTIRAPRSTGRQDKHVLRVRLIGFSGRQSLHRASASFHVSPDPGREKQVEIMYPHHGDQVENDALEIHVTVKTQTKEEQVVCLSLNEDRNKEENTICLKAAEGEKEEEEEVRHVISGLRSGTKYHLAAWMEVKDGRRGNPLSSPAQPSQHYIRFETTSTMETKLAPASEKQGPKPFVFVSAASQSYYDEQRLQNMVGSIHYWEPQAPIIIYSLGLSEETLQDMRTWAHTTVQELRLEGLPPHVGDWQQYAFKPIILRQALEQHPQIFWLDANIELRRPLNEVRRIMDKSGAFFAEQPVDFPTPQFHFPQVVHNLGCHVPNFSRQHCSTAFIGFKTKNWIMEEILDPTVRCALDQSCINPPGATRANHRQEQTVVNSIMCSLNISICQPGMKWRLSSDFEHDDFPLQPTDDETDFNELVFYTRRNIGMKPYVRHLQRGEVVVGGAKADGEWIE